MKLATVDEAVAGIDDGATVLVGGFGQAGMPFDLVDGLIRQGAKDLTIVMNSSAIVEISGRNALTRLTVKSLVSIRRDTACSGSSMRGNSFGMTPPWCSALVCCVGTFALTLGSVIATLTSS
jgi:acyl CoA:acetate/3-ketoacid CoA transferase alpha subunit